LSAREYIRTQIDTLPDVTLERVAEFIAFQKFSSGYDNETDYLTSIPGMAEKIEAASREPHSGGVPVSGLWPDV